MNFGNDWLIQDSVSSQLGIKRRKRKYGQNNRVSLGAELLRSRYNSTC